MSIGSYIHQKFDSLKAGWLLEQIASMPQRYYVGAINDRSDLEAACRLLYREYLRRKYCNRSALRLHFNRHMFANESRTFIIGKTARILGTLSVFPDSSAGVPSEELYPNEIAEFRRLGIKFAEVGLLATDLANVSGYSLNSPEKMHIVFSLFKVMVNYVMTRGISHLVILVNPKHERLYRFLGFRAFAEVRSYPGACGAPALPMILELAYFNTRKATRRWFLENCFEKSTFENQLAGNPQAFAELFGDSFHDFNERYNQKRHRVNNRSETTPVANTSADTVRLNSSEL